MIIGKELIEETASRYQQRQPVREEHRRKLSRGDLLDLDSPERMQKRLARIARITEPMVPSVAAPSAELHERGILLERIFGQSDLVSVSYLEVGLLVARSVARIRVRGSKGELAGWGTGVIVAPRLMLTNNHVVHDPAVAARTWAEFDVQEGVDGKLLPSTIFDLAPDALFVTDPELDYTLVAVAEVSHTGTPLAAYGWLPIIEEEGKAVVGEYLNIIQHPNGEPKQLALRNNRLIDVLENFLHYETDTAPGSSGAPVLNNQWELVALHHSGVANRDGEGRVLTREGTIWNPSMGEHTVDWKANEGVRISRVAKHVRQQELSSATQRALRDTLFEAGPPPIRVPPLASTAAVAVAQASAAALEVAVPGPLSWTIPVTITVAVGEPSSPPPPA